MLDKISLLVVNNPIMDSFFDSFAHRKDPCSKVFPFLNIWLGFHFA